MRHCGVVGRTWGNDVVDLVFLKVGLCGNGWGVEVGILILISCRTLIGRVLRGCGHVGDSAGRSNAAKWGLKQHQVL